MTKSIVCLQALTAEQREAVIQASPGYTFIQSEAKNPDIAALAEAEIVIGWANGISDTLLREGGPLRWVQTWSAGVDTMPLQALAERNICLTNASGVHSKPIAQVIFGFILIFARNFHKAIRNQEHRLWVSRDGMESTELTGRTAVIVGTGEIGSETARIAKAFDMRTVGVRTSGEPLPGFDEMFESARLKEAVSAGDYVINTLPLTDDTHHLFGASVFSSFKEDSCYINIGRGGTTDTEALIQALNEGKLRGAGLDVFETEPLPIDHPLWGMEQVVISPHVAGATDHYADRVVAIFAENMKSYLSSGRPSRNLVNYARQY
ncbi:D-2-hydroxyacid dehydrogenase [Paenibacillus sp. HN-1]|uniref:D-2-hydroxyacid dehydrogenase n=1 Tax=Paenibacillus TaxID=44249 RepID=UPI001CA8AEBD|nr:MULTISPECIES: D-2-hydroxyacid dehydrogenase [Paenibacillus]MBY9081282.1 D-2-hydroxyacid dehydrogenase [Paenibacillus sp. CGMCC 1.18879]MBY9087555.1 D-2-hydroxyacid dehydrogenase [Paenibacillus sinensis]